MLLALWLLCYFLGLSMVLLDKKSEIMLCCVLGRPNGCFGEIVKSITFLQSVLRY